MAAQVTLTEPEVRAFSSLLTRISERLANYEQQTHQDVRHAEELKAAAEISLVASSSRHRQRSELEKPRLPRERFRLPAGRKGFLRRAVEQSMR